MGMMLRKKFQKPPRPPGPAAAGGRVNYATTAGGAVRKTMPVNNRPAQNAKPTPSYVGRRPSTASSRSPSPRQDREPFSDNTSKFSSASTSNRSTASSAYRVQKGLGKARKGHQQLPPSKPSGPPNAGSAWNRVAIQNNLPTIQEAESAYSGMSGVISSFSGHSSADEDAASMSIVGYDGGMAHRGGNRDYTTEFEFDENTAYFTEYGTEYTGGMMSDMGGTSGGWSNTGTKYTTTGASIRTGLSSITQDTETYYDTHYTAITDATDTMTAYTDYSNMGPDEYSAYSTGATNYTAGTETAYSLDRKPTQSIDDYSRYTDYTDASTAYDTAYTGTTYMELRDHNKYAETFDDGADGDVFDFDLQDLSTRFKRGVKSMFACDTSNPLSPPAHPHSPYIYPQPASNAVMTPSRSVPTVASGVSKQSKQSLGDCLL